MTNGAGGIISEEQATVYDRQIRLWGVETQKRWAAKSRLDGEGFGAADVPVDVFLLHLFCCSCIWWLGFKLRGSMDIAVTALPGRSALCLLCRYAPASNHIFVVNKHAAFKQAGFRET